jgi:hypothetical protein
MSINNDTFNIQYLLREIKKAIQNNSIDTSSAFKIISVSMEIMENIKIDGNKKKDILLLTFKELIKNEDNLISNDIIDILKPLVENDVILAGIIEIVCIASKGELNINKIKKGCISLCT